MGNFILPMTPNQLEQIRRQHHAVVVVFMKFVAEEIHLGEVVVLTTQNM
jgi:hypothetical protein